MDKKTDDYGESSAEQRAHLRKWVGVRERGEKQNKTFLTQPTSLEM